MAVNPAHILWNNICVMPELRTLCADVPSLVSTSTGFNYLLLTIPCGLRKSTLLTLLVMIKPRNLRCILGFTGSPHYRSLRPTVLKPSTAMLNGPNPR